MRCAVKILLVGDWHSSIHEEAAGDALEALGCQVIRFKWNAYFFRSPSRFAVSNLSLRLQNRFMFGPVVAKLNLDLVSACQSIQPDIVFIYRGSHIYPKTVREMRAQSRHSVFVSYNNDDPFSPIYPFWMWRHYLSSLPFFDLSFAYRPHNLSELQAAGARRVALLRSWFVPELNKPICLSALDRNRYACDVVFIGHYENDGRLKYLEEVVRRGYHLRIFGHPEQWNPVLKRSRLLAGFAPVHTVWGADYNAALNAARVALCFFSRLNRDGYTRRCFEIPAARTVLMSEYSDDLASLYRDMEEVVMFRDFEEFGNRLDLLLTDERRRAIIASAGHRRVFADRHDVRSRMEDVLQLTRSLVQERSRFYE